MTRRTLAAVFLLALALRAGAALARRPVLDGDQTAHLEAAVAMARGDGFVAAGRPETHIQPLFPALHAAAIRVLPVAPERAGRLLALIVSSLLAPACAVLAARALGPRQGLAAGLAVTLEPHLVVRGVSLETESLAALLGAWAGWSVLRGEAVLAATAMGLAYLTRPEWCVAAPVAAIALAARGVEAKRIAVGAAAFGALFAIVPLYLHAAEGTWGISGKGGWVYLNGVHQWRSGNQPLPVAEIPALEREIDTPLGHAVAHPGAFVRGYAYRAGLLALHLARALDWVLVPFAVAGLVVVGRQDPRAWPALAIPLGVLPVLPLGATYFRHALEVTPALLTFAAWTAGGRLPRMR